MRRLVCFGLLFVLATTIVVVQNRVNLNYKARLMDAGDMPITTPTPAQSTLCQNGDPAAIGTCGGGTIAYRETSTISPDGNGGFDYLIGTGTHTPPDLDFVLFNTTQALYSRFAQMERGF